MPTSPIVLITGATGKQGGAVARALIGKGFALHALTRKPDSAPARALERLGVTIVPGDLDDAASLQNAVGEAWGVFSVQNSWDAGVEREEEHGKRLARLALEAGVQHFVYSSVGSAHRKTRIPHFDSKWRIEEAVRELGFPSHVILRPVYFMENLVAPYNLNGNQLTSTLAPTTELQMIAVDDVGRYGARAFIDGQHLSRRELDIAGDTVTLPAAAAVLGAALGRPIEYVQVPLDEVEKTRPDIAVMLDWFERVGFNVHIDRLTREFGIEPTRLTEWGRRLKAQSSGGSMDPSGR